MLYYSVGRANQLSTVITEVDCDLTCVTLAILKGLGLFVKLEKSDN